MRIRAALYRPARHLYQAALNRPYARARRAQQRLLSQFVRAGDLVFDVGANRGDYTDVLLGLGARVVAIEPNPRLARLIEDRYQVVVVEVAAGAACGRAELRLGRYDGHSTLSERWASSHEERFEGTADVAVVTLASLARRYGQPAFVKIDVEGYEPEVLRGVAEAVPALSFEFQRAALGLTEECLALLPGYRFAYAQQAETGLSAWTDAPGLLEQLAALADAHAYGDVYATA